MATVRLSAKSLDPTQITRIFLIKPDLEAKRGEGLIQKADRSRVPAKVGTWYVTTKHHVSNQSPADHLAWVLHLVTSKLGALRQTVPDLNVNFSLLVHDAEFETASLPLDLLKEVVSIGDLEIEVPERAMDVVLDSNNLGEHLRA